MSNAVVQGLFLLSFWAPPLTVVAGAVLLLVKTPERQLPVKTPARPTSPLTAQTATAHR